MLVLFDIESIRGRVEALQAELPTGVTLVVATKYLPAEALPTIYDAGVRHFGESHVQEVILKQALLLEVLGQEKLAEIQWHFIGSLQKNKVNKTVGRFALIHSVDSLELAEKLSEANLKAARVQPILLQVNLTREAQKHGFLEEDMPNIVTQVLDLKGIQLKGLMCFGVTPNTNKTADWESKNKTVFSRLQALGTALEQYLGQAPLELSMGMSQDYGHALEFGATIIRIGRHLLGDPIL